MRCTGLCILPLSAVTGTPLYQVTGAPTGLAHRQVFLPNSVKLNIFLDAKTPEDSIYSTLLQTGCTCLFDMDPSATE